MKRSVLILVVAMLLSVANSWAQSGACGDNLTWRLSGAGDSYTLTISGSGVMDDYTRPTIDGDNSRISPWFSYQTPVTNVIIEDGVTTIGECAFIHCTRLSAVSMPNSLTSIRNNAFAWCSGLTAVTIPSSVTTIGEYAFAWCSGLSSVTIPNSVTAINDYVFAGCSGLASIGVDDNNTNYSSEDGILFNKSKTTIVQYPAGKPDAAYIISNSVTAIGYGAFAFCPNLSAVTIPSSVTTIGEMAFYGCSGLAAVTIPNSVTTIGNSAFSGCSGLTAVTIPSSVTTIEDWAFSGCTVLEEVTVEWTTPLDAPDGIFSQVNTSDATLLVPIGTKTLYQAAPVWKDFAIVEYDLTGNDNIHIPTLKAYASNGILYISGLQPGKPLLVYTLSGQLVYQGLAKTAQESVAVATRGIYIIVSEKQTIKVIAN